jgi:hypothetical protein
MNLYKIIYIIACLLIFLFYIKKKCKYVPSYEQVIFGPKLWDAFHTISQNYPKKPSNKTKQNCLKFIESIPYMLPCGQCGYHLKNFLNKQDINKACTDKDSLIMLFVNAHNNVNYHTHDNAKLWNIEDVKKKYQYGLYCENHKSKEWVDKSLKRSQ